jgi:hypothetical protein
MRTYHFQETENPVSCHRLCSCSLGRVKWTIVTNDLGNCFTGQIAARVYACSLVPIYSGTDFVDTDIKRFAPQITFRESAGDDRKDPRSYILKSLQCLLSFASDNKFRLESG